MKPRKIAEFVLFSLFWFALSAPPVQAQASVSGPAVSGIQAEVKNNLIRLTWTDSPAAQGPVYIYRSSSPFSEANPYYRIRPIEVPYEAQSYIDEVDSAGIWHYFIVASEATGRRYENIARENTAEVRVGDIEEAPVLPAAPVPAAAPEDSKFSALEAAVRGDRVLVSFSLNARVTETVLYRSVGPITRTQDLLNAVIIQSGVNSPYTDYPVPGIPYYYAVIAEEDLISGDVRIFPGHNATLSPVEVPTGSRIGLGDSPVIRSMPLPMIAPTALSPNAESFMDVVIPVPLSPEAALAAADLKPSLPPRRPPTKALKTFPEDLAPPAGGGDEYALRSIVQGSLMAQEWEAAREEFLTYLALPRSDRSEGRARFYLGQIYYFNGSFREALFEFLFAQVHYPDMANEWIQATLTELINEG
jgi:hypothetical protein